MRKEKEMKEVLNNMIAHPIKTSLVVGAIGIAISDIIRAVRGKAGTPVFNLVVGAKSKEKNQEEC